MSGDPSQRSPPDRRYRTANEIVRSILDDRPATATVSPSGELYRAIERYHRNILRARRDLPAVQPLGSSMPSGSGGDLRRRFNRDPQAPNSPPRGVTLPGISAITEIAAPHPPLPPLRSRGSRRGSGMSTPGGSGGRPARHRSSDRHVDNRSRTSATANFIRGTMNPTFEDLDRNLEDANSHLRALLDFSSNSPVIPPLVSPSGTPQDYAEEGRRIKRRRLDSERSAHSFRGFRYGKFGQVEPGQLNMEIASCDGGLYSNEASYAAENILKDDASVYCTQGNRCNIVLRHQGATVFSLQELVIKAPGSNYSAPVREGMVFVAMDSDELLARTAQYQIQYLPSRHSERRRASQRESRRAPAVYSIRHGEDGNAITRLQSRQRWPRSTDMDDYDIADLDDEDEHSRVAQIPAEFTVSPPPFHVTTECSDDESETELGFGDPGYRRPRRRAPNRIGALPFETHEGDSSDDSANVWGPSGSDWATIDGIARGQYRREREEAGLTLAEARETAQIATQEAVRAVGGELMTPLAHFYIEKDKNKCTIRFDPPVSGRFVLLKMWSPHHDPSANIDIQGVVAKGFAGPRYFPAVELR